MPSPIDDLTTHLVLLSGGTGWRDDRAGHLLGQWASSSTWAHHRFLVAAMVIGPYVHKGACKAALAQYGWGLLTLEAMVELVLNMRVPKNVFRQVCELITLQQLRYWSTVTQLNSDYYIGPLSICTGFDLKWKELITPFGLIRRHPPHIPALQRWCAPGLVDPVPFQPAYVDPAG